MQRNRMRLRLDRQLRQQHVMCEFDGVKELHAVEVLLVLFGQVAARGPKAVSARAGINHDGQLPLLGPSPATLDRSVNCDGVCAAKALRGKRSSAAGARDVCWDENRNARAAGDLDRDFHERRIFRLAWYSAHHTRDTRREINCLRSRGLLFWDPTSGVRRVGHPLSQVAACEALHHTRERAHASDPDHSFCCVSQSQRQPQHAFSERKVVGDTHRPFLRTGGGAKVAEALHQLAGIDAHRTSGRAQSIGGAGVQRHVREFAVERLVQT